MDQKQPPSRRETIGIGAICAAIGLYFALVGLDLVPAPGEANAPMWIAFLAGLCFLLGGLAVLVPTLATGEVRADGELPTGAPLWLRVFQYLLGLAIFASFASIGTWIAFAGGARSFGVSTPFFTTSGGSETLGHTVFGIGAVVTWLALIAVGISGWRKLVRRNKV